MSAGDGTFTLQEWHVPMDETRNSVVQSCVIVSLMAFTLFFAIAAGVRQDNALTQLDSQIASSLHESKMTSPGWTRFFEGVKELAGLGAIGLVAVVATILFIYGRTWLALAWGTAVLGGALLNDHVLKRIFQRERPPFGKPRDATDWSFPSGHSMRGIVMYGMLAYLLVLVLPRRWARVLAVSLLALVVLAIGFSRIYLGKHYFSDVCGSFVFGAGWIAGWIGLIELMGWRHRKQESLAPISNEMAPDTSPNPSTL
jgi:undecaprenyl-diphosphatase